MRTGILLLLLLTTVGCSKFDLRENFPWKTSSDEPQIPGRITALWSHTILEQPGRRGIRGFGGRLMFHDREGGSPVVVDGDIVVYAFDDTDGPKSHPEKKFVFTSSDLPSHHSESRLGHSYSLWLPWDEVGGPPRKVSLVVRFTPAGSGTIMSESAQVLLPGIDPEVKAEIQQAAAKFRDQQKQKQLQAAAASAGNVAPIPTGDNSIPQTGVSQASASFTTDNFVKSTQRTATISQQPNGLDVITLDTSPNLGLLLKNAPTQPQPNQSQQFPLQPPPQQPTTIPPATLNAPPYTLEKISPIKASLAERAAARRPTRFARSQHRAQALGAPLTAPGRASPQLDPATQPSPQTGSPSLQQNAPLNPASGSSSSTIAN